MAEPTNSLIAFSDAAAQLVERSASSTVAVHGGGRWPSSGIHWRSSVIVTAEEVLFLIQSAPILWRYIRSMRFFSPLLSQQQRTGSVFLHHPSWR